MEENFSSRSILLEVEFDAVQTEEELQRLIEYKEKIAAIQADENMLSVIRPQIKSLAANRTPENERKRKTLWEEAQRLRKRLDEGDRELIAMEQVSALQEILRRERDKRMVLIKQCAEEQRCKAEINRERTVWRSCIRNTLEQTCRHSRKYQEKYPAFGMLNEVSKRFSFLILADTEAKEGSCLVFETCRDRLDALKKASVMVQGEERERLETELRETRKHPYRTSEQLDELRRAYQALKKRFRFGKDHGFDETVAREMETVGMAVGDIPLSVMSLSELEQVFDVLKAVLDRIRNAHTRI